MEDLDIWHEGLNISLLDFQSSLGKAVAAVTWFSMSRGRGHVECYTDMQVASSGRNRNYTLQYTDEDVQANPYANMTGEASILSYTLRMRLHVRPMLTVASEASFP